MTGRASWEPAEKTPCHPVAWDRSAREGVCPAQEERRVLVPARDTKEADGMAGGGDVGDMTERVANFVAVVSKRLPDDVVDKLSELRRKEDGPLGKTIYDSLFANLEQAQALDRPCCQDTGVISYFVKAGTRFPLLASLPRILVDAVKRATSLAPLRHNAVEIFDEVNTGTNVGERIPYIHWELVDDGDDVEIEVYMAGGGSSLPGRAVTLMPSAGYESIARYVLDTVVEWGINACPPLVVGVGIAGSSEIASLLSKKAILRPIGTRHPNPKGAALEQLLEQGLNELGMGPQGLEGKSPVLAVHIESAARHPSTLAAGISIGCWAHRRGTIRFHRDLSSTIISHRGVTV
jgi:L(+)-tartrate dehydratase alpha subunit